MTAAQAWREMLAADQRALTVRTPARRAYYRELAEAAHAAFTAALEVWETAA